MKNFFFIFLGITVGTISLDSFSMQLGSMDWYREKVASQAQDVRSIVQNLDSLQRTIACYCINKSENDKDGVIEQVEKTKNAFDVVSSTITSMAVDHLSIESKLYKFFNERQLPISSHLAKAFGYISGQFDQLQLTLGNAESTLEEISAQSNSVYNNVNFLFLLFHGSIKYGALAKRIPDQEFYNRCFKGIHEWDLFSGDYGKKLALEQARNKNEDSHKAAKKVKEKIENWKKCMQGCDDIANKPDLSGLVLLFLDPPFLVKNILKHAIEPFIKKFPDLSQRATVVLPQLADVKQAMQQNMVPSKLMDYVPGQLRPALIPIFRYWGKPIINPLVWSLNKFARYMVNTGEKCVDTWLCETEKPLLEDQLFSYLRQAGLLYKDLSEKPTGSSSFIDLNMRMPLCSLSMKTIMAEQTRMQEERKGIKQQYRYHEIVDRLDDIYLSLNKLYLDLADLLRKIKTMGDCTSARANEVRNGYINEYDVIQSQISNLEKEESDKKKQKEDADRKLSNIEIWRRWFKEEIEKKNKEKAALAELRAVSSCILLECFQELFKEKSISGDLYAHYQGLAMSNAWEFRALLKKYYKNSRYVQSQLLTVQDLFNNWFKIVVEREHAPLKAVLESHNSFFNDLQKKAKKHEEKIAGYKAEIKKHFFATRLFYWLYYAVAINKQQRELDTCNQLYTDGQKVAAVIQEKDLYKMVQQTIPPFERRHDLVSALLEKVSCKKKKAQVTTLNIESFHNHREQKREFVTKEIKVTKQQGAECGYHALYNALHSVNGFVRVPSNNEDFVNLCKKRVTLSRNNHKNALQLQPKNLVHDLIKENGYYEDAQWISEEEVLGLLDGYRQAEGGGPITVIPDIQKYRNQESQGLDESVIKDIAEAQGAIKEGKDYERVYILGTMQESQSYSNESYNGHASHGHWIAVKQIIRGGNVSYEIMDSLGSSCEQLVGNLTALLHTDNIFLPIDPQQSRKLTDLIEIIAFSKALSGSHYALMPVNHGKDTCSVVDQLPHDLIDRIIQACADLIKETLCKPFHNCTGYRKPKEIVIDALKTIESCNKREITVKAYCTDRAGIPCMVQLTKQQKCSIEFLQEILKDL